MLFLFRGHSNLSAPADGGSLLFEQVENINEGFRVYFRLGPLLNNTKHFGLLRHFDVLSDPILR